MRRLDNFNHSDVTQSKIEVISTLTQPIANNSELIKMKNIRLLLVTKILEDKTLTDHQIRLMLQINQALSRGSPIILF